MLACCCNFACFKSLKKNKKNPSMTNPRDSGRIISNSSGTGVITTTDGTQCGIEFTSQHNIVIVGSFNKLPVVPDTVASVSGSYRYSSGSDSLPRIDFNIDVFKDERFSDMSATIFHTLSSGRSDGTNSRATSPINHQPIPNRNSNPTIITKEGGE